MINLLPPDSKSTLVYARRNTQLIRFVIGLAIGALGIIIVVGFSMLYLDREINSYKSSIAQAEKDLKAQKETQVVAEVQSISESLNLVVNVLNQEILFSNLIQEIGSVMPAGTVLKDLSLSNELTGALTLQAGAVTDQAASQIQVNLRDPKNNIFSAADLESIECIEPEPPQPGEIAEPPDPYPCTASIRALFAKGNSFTLLGGEAKDE